MTHHNASNKDRLAGSNGDCWLSDVALIATHWQTYDESCMIDLKSSTYLPVRAVGDLTSSCTPIIRQCWPINYVMYTLWLRLVLVISCYDQELAPGPQWDHSFKRSRVALARYIDNTKFGANAPSKKISFGNLRGRCNFLQKYYLFSVIGCVFWAVMCSPWGRAPRFTGLEPSLMWCDVDRRSNMST